MSGARALAHSILLDREKGRVDLERGFSGSAPADRGVAHELVLGVRRHLFLLDSVLRQFVKDKISSVPPAAREALRLGAYDLLFRESVPTAVAVGESVGLAGRNAKARGFVNAVLRRLSEGFQRIEGETPRDRHHLPLAPSKALRFEKAVLPDPAAQPAKYFSTLHTLTEWFVDEMRRELPLEHEEFFSACGQRLPVMMRPTRTSGGPEALMRRLTSEGCREVSRRGNGIEFQSPVALAQLPSLRDGVGIVQDACAAEVAPFVAPRALERVLDYCAVSGGKAVHLLELMDDQGTLVAAHPASARARLLEENFARHGLKSFVIHDLGPKGDHLPEGPFDRILVDAPCSNSGVLMKRVDARFRLHPSEVERLAAVQRTLLHRAGRLLRRGGVIVYSTCSVLAAENHAVVRRVARENPELRLDEERLRFPHRTLRDGGYHARLIKR